MCGRFINLNTTKKLNKIFDFINKDKIDDEISYNIAPSQSSIIITNSNFFYIEKAKWGIKFFDKIQKREKNIINSRIETVDKKIIFKESFNKRRCIIPANGYYEWSLKNKIKTPYFINIPEKETIYFAGIWKYIDQINLSKKVFSIITKPSNSLLSNIHHRMPIILSSDESKDYLDKSNLNYLQYNKNSNIESYIEFYEISRFVNNPLNNSIKCIQHIN